MNTFKKSFLALIPFCTLMIFEAQSAAVFNEACYLKRYPDVVTGFVNRGGKAIDHWLKYGQFEKRNPGCDAVVVAPPPVPVVVAPKPVVSAPVVVKPVVTTPAPTTSINVFNEACYLKRYPDVVTGFVNRGGKAIDHWTKYGQAEKRIPGCDPVATTPVVTPPVVVVTPPVVTPPVNTDPVNTISSSGALPIKLSVSPVRFAGAVESLKWDGKEFINIKDHGRQLQTAIQIDGYKECNNPTEAGTEADARAATSTSKLLELKKISKSSLSTKSQMAYWAFQKLTGACVKGLDSRVKNKLSDQVLEKTISMDAFNDPQIIDYSIKVKHQAGSVTEGVVYEFLTGYLNSEFDKFYYVSLANSALNPYEATDLVSLSGQGFPNGSFYGKAAKKKAYDPVIMATATGSHAMGVYVSEKSITSCKSQFHGYNVFKFNLGGSGPDGNSTNKWSLALGDSINSPCIVNNSREFKVYLVVGKLADVHEKLLKIYKSVP